MPAEAGIQKCLKTLDSRLRGNDANGRFQTFYEGIFFGFHDIIYLQFGGDSWWKLRNKYPKIDCCRKAMITSSPGKPRRL